MTHDEAIALAERHELYVNKGETLQLYESIIAAILEAANGRWREIDSAPKDGTRVLIFDSFGNRVTAEYHPGPFKYHHEPGWYSTGSAFGEDDSPRPRVPVAWQPLPPPPTGAPK